MIDLSGSEPATYRHRRLQYQKEVCNESEDAGADFDKKRTRGDSNLSTATTPEAKLSIKKSESSCEKAKSEHLDETSSAKVLTNNSEPFNNDFYARSMHALPADLSAVVNAWPNLPEAVKTGILAMISAIKPKALENAK